MLAEPGEWCGRPSRPDQEVLASGRAYWRQAAAVEGPAAGNIAEH